MSRFPILVFVAGCTGVPNSSPGDTTGNGAPTVSATDTGWPPGDVGNFHLAYHTRTGATDVYALAAASPPNLLNLAQCAIDGSVCIGGIPRDPDTSEPFDPDADVDRDTLTTRYLGYEVGFGPFTLEYRESDDGFGSYRLEVGPDDAVPEGWVGASWAGQWPEYQSHDDLYVAPPIELLSPQAGGSVQFTNTESAVIEWAPTSDPAGAETTVTLAVVPKFGDGRFFHLTDDGYYELTAADLGLTGDVEDLTFVLTRWSMAEISRFGHVVNFVASSDVTFEGQLLNIGNRDELVPPDGCDQAIGNPALEAGSYWGLLGGALDGDLNPTNGCLGASPDANAAGVDGVFKITVPYRHQVSVDYNLLTASAAVYLLEDCHTDTSCVAGSDSEPDPNQHEFTSYFNADDDPKDLYLVLDETGGNTSSVFTLDLQDQELEAPVLYDFCAEASEAAGLDEGTYYVDFVAYTGDLNPGTGGCTDTSMPGPESIAPIDLAAGETLVVNVDMSGGDPGIYLLFDCTRSNCFLGDDDSTDGIEALTYTNNGAFPQRVYLVIDSKTGLAPYFLSIGKS